MQRATSSKLSSSLFFAGVLTILASHGNVLACGPTQQQIDQWVKQSLSTDESVSASGISAFRSMGQFGLNRICQAYDTMLAGQSIDGAPASAENLQRLSRAIDAVAKQRDATASRLFWHTDLNQAIEQAKRSGRPVLSLRLLGNLEDDLSCANSRFFRTVLYANAEIANYLRDHYVLHWQSLRPVPKITIDFGDGRRLERTITGNSIHYVLDSNGEIVDAIPGLYGPAAFLKLIQSDESLAMDCAKFAEPGTRANYLHDRHMTAIDESDRAWRDDLNQLGIDLPKVTGAASTKSSTTSTPLAIQAAPIAQCKMSAEEPLLGAVFESAANHAALEAAMNDDLWSRIAALHANEAVLDASSLALMRAKLINAPAMAAARVAPSKSAGESPLFRILRTFQHSISIDAVRNEYVIHRRIHQWIADGDARDGIDALNDRIYAELFLTPLSDPWMGMAPPDVYAALDRSGLTDCSAALSVSRSTSPRHP